VSAIEQREAKRQNAERDTQNRDFPIVKARHDLFDLRATTGVSVARGRRGAACRSVDVITCAREAVEMSLGFRFLSEVVESLAGDVHAVGPRSGRCFRPW